MSHDNEKAIRAAYQVAEEQDVAGWIAAFTEDGTFTDMSLPLTCRGPEELGKTVEVYTKAFPDMHRELERFYVTGDIVVVQLRLQGTHLGPLELSSGTVPPTGRRMDAPCCDVFELVDGRASASTATRPAQSSPPSSAWPEPVGGGECPRCSIVT
ncbi:nuclear transport factor 2 family protein [Kitasatospora sp. NPDC101155]|uniref:nuclear transport factor 2 family protein n=1 Tax=Kitasatospora sp. NPDC101155 TaxID=3364097 RepID=UPI0037FA1692